MQFVGARWSLGGPGWYPDTAGGLPGGFGVGVGVDHLVVVPLPKNFMRPPSSINQSSRGR